jgi:hypothetical protein
MFRIGSSDVRWMLLSLLAHRPSRVVSSDITLDPRGVCRFPVSGAYGCQTGRPTRGLRPGRPPTSAVEGRLEVDAVEPALHPTQPQAGWKDIRSRQSRLLACGCTLWLAEREATRLWGLAVTDTGFRLPEHQPPPRARHA